MINNPDHFKSKKFSRYINFNFTGFYVLIVSICLVVLILTGCDNQVDQSRLNHAIKAEFVDPKSCIECHEKQYMEWRGSHHDLAMDVATEETVLADFNNSTFINYGLTTTFYKRDRGFFVRTDGPDGKLTDYKISYVFGVDPLQQYMVKFPDGRIQVLDIAWDTRSEEEGGQRWFHLFPDEAIPFDDDWKLEIDGAATAARSAFGLTTAFDVPAAGEAVLRYRSPSGRTLLVAMQVLFWLLAFVAATRLGTSFSRRRPMIVDDETLIHLDADAADLSQSPELSDALPGLDPGLDITGEIARGASQAAPGSTEREI